MSTWLHNALVRSFWIGSAVLVGAILGGASFAAGHTGQFSPTTGPANYVGHDHRDEGGGGGGNDDMASYGGQDDFTGGDGKDDVGAGAGSDIVQGGGGEDIVLGQDGWDDLVTGGGGADSGSGFVHGGNGQDDIFGGDGIDDIYGTGDSGDADTLDGGAPSGGYEADYCFVGNNDVATDCIEI